MYNSWAVLWVASITVFVFLPFWCAPVRGAGKAVDEGV